MFVRNKTKGQVVLAHGYLTDERAVLSLNIEVVLRPGPGGALEVVRDLPRAEGDPPDLGRTCVWEGVSVTASGHALCPARPPYVAAVSLRVGDREHRVVAVGPRVWTRGMGGDLVPSEPGRFDRIAVDWKGAFGGQHLLEPGILEGTNLPYPGGTIAYALNPLGMGWYPYERLAVGAPLPLVEDPGAPIRRWSEAAFPAGIAPGQLAAMHLATRPPSFDTGKARFAELLQLPNPSLWVQHHAPPALVFPSLPADTPVSLAGLSASLALRVPASPITVTLVRRREQIAVAGLVRSVHLDTDRGVVRVSYGHGAPYSPAKPPEWVDVTRSEGSLPL